MSIHTIDENKGFNLPKPNLGSIKKPELASIKKFTSKPLVKEILSNAYLGVLCYGVIFILGEILISGGKSERNPYYIAVMVIFLVVAQLLFISRDHYKTLRSTAISALAITMTIALLDYLLVNLWLEKNNLVHYTNWPVYLIYITTIVVPFIRSGLIKIKLPNLKSLLTKKERTL